MPDLSKSCYVCQADLDKAIPPVQVVLKRHRYKGSDPLPYAELEPICPESFAVRLKASKGETVRYDVPVCLSCMAGIISRALMTMAGVDDEAIAPWTKMEGK